MKIVSDFISKNLSAIILILAVLVTSVIKFMEVSGNNFPFTMDQGRDMVDMRHMVVTHTPRLVGPTTSINGVLLGPFWYYFNLPAFLIGGGDPSTVVYWQIIWYQISAIALWWIIKKKNNSLATIIALLYLFMPTGFNTARYFWNANSMPFFTSLFFISLILATEKTNFVRLLILGLVAGLSMQIEAAFGILFFPFAFLYYIFLSLQSRQSRASILTQFKNLISLTAGFGITLIPQAFFELRHGFIMTKILISEFTGKGEMLGEKITFSTRLSQRWEYLLDLIRHQNHIPETPLLIIFAFAFIYVVYKLIRQKPIKKQSLFFVSFGFIVFSAIFYIIFPQKLKIWYTLGLSVPLMIFISSFFSELYNSNIKFLKIVTVLFLMFTVFYSIKAQTSYIEDNYGKISNDRSNMANEIAAIDWVYQNADGRGFKVYSYLPSVYDFPYNHLFWWYGNKKYGYQPWETAYLPNQPEYIKDVPKIWKSTKPLDKSQITFLIIEEDGEMPQRTKDWLGNFSSLCLVKQESFSWGSQVRMMTVCKK